MHRVVALWQLALCVTGIQASLPFHPKAHENGKDTEQRDIVTRDAGPLGFITFKMVKTTSSVCIHSARTLQVIADKHARGMRIYRNE